MRKKDRSPYSFRRKQSLNYLVNLSSKETSLVRTVRACARANDARNYAQYEMRNAILRNDLISFQLQLSRFLS